jgi:hypothetical protein
MYSIAPAQQHRHGRIAPNQSFSIVFIRHFGHDRIALDQFVRAACVKALQEDSGNNIIKTR